MRFIIVALSVAVVLVPVYTIPVPGLIDTVINTVTQVPQQTFHISDVITAAGTAINNAKNIVDQISMGLQDAAEKGLEALDLAIKDATETLSKIRQYATNAINALKDATTDANVNASEVIDAAAQTLFEVTLQIDEAIAQAQADLKNSGI